MYTYLGAYVSSLKNGIDLRKERGDRAIKIYNFLRINHFNQFDSLCSADLHDQLKNNTRLFFRALRIDIVSNMLMPGDFEIANKKNWPMFDSIKNGCLFISAWQNVLFTIFIISSIIFIVAFRSFMDQTVFIFTCISWVIASFVIVISGVSYWQNNRFTVICTPMVLINMALLIGSVRNKVIAK